MRCLEVGDRNASRRARYECLGGCVPSESRVNSAVASVMVKYVLDQPNHTVPYGTVLVLTYSRLRLATFITSLLEIPLLLGRLFIPLLDVLVDR